jgi:hypothetical protein
LVKIDGRLVEDAESARLPSTSFRFKYESAELIDRLKSIVESYCGAIGWVMTPHVRDALPGINWVIEPALAQSLREEAEVLSVPLQVLLRQRMPEFSMQAFRDLLGLVRHVKSTWDCT